MQYVHILYNSLSEKASESYTLRYSFNCRLQLEYELMYIVRKYEQNNCTAQLYN